VLNDTDGCIIVANYVYQLDDEEAVKYPVGPAPVTTYNNNFAPNYAFTRQNHSYGTGNSNNV
jgi:hypothetical protein